MRLRTHPDGSIWTRDGRLLWYYPAVEQHSEPPILDSDPYDWDGYTGRAQAKELSKQQRDRYRQQAKAAQNGVLADKTSHWPILDDVQPERNRPAMINIVDASAQWVCFGDARFREGDVLQHANNNCIEILDAGVRVGGGIRHKFKAKPAVHTDALRAGEWWTLID